MSGAALLTETETRQRNDAAELHRQVVFGRSGGRIIWQPRILCWYDDRQFKGEGLPAPYTDLDLYSLYKALGCSARLYEYNTCFKRVEHPSVKKELRQLTATDTETTIHTPVGMQKTVTRYTPNSPHPITLKWEVETPDELKVAAWREENVSWEWDEATWVELKGRLGSLGAPTMFMPRMNVQCLYLDKMGIEKGIQALYEWTDQVEAFFRTLEGSHERLMDVIVPSPIEIINFGENVHAGTLSPELFLKYHLPACQRRCERLHAAGKFVSSHWDGDTRPLLPYIKETGLDGIEAITPRPQGDVTLGEIRQALGDDMVLLDGIPAVFFDRTYPVDVLLAFTRQIIHMFAPRLVLGITPEISSAGDILRVRQVGALVEEYNSTQVTLFEPRLDELEG